MVNAEASRLLDGFSVPVPFTRQSAAGAPDGPGVHVVWGPDPSDGIIYVGETGQLRERLRAHLTGSGSVLAEQVLAAVSREPEGGQASDLIRAWLSRCMVAWKETPDHTGLKRDLVLAYRPRFNRVVPEIGQVETEGLDPAASDLIEKLFRLKRGNLGSDRLAPHKPVLVLLALERIRRRRERLGPYREWSDPLARLLRMWPETGAVPSPEEPIWRMQRDEIWEVLDGDYRLVPQGGVGAEPRLSELSAESVRAGLISQLHEVLAADVELLAKTAVRLAEHYFPDQSQEALERVRAVLETGPMKVWWVNQGQSYRPERDGWFVWAPLQTKAGHPVAHHSNVSRLKPGDAVVHYSQGSIRAVGEVIGPPEERKTRPADLPGDLWGNEGHYCSVEYFELPSPVRLEDIPGRMGGGGPFNVVGGVQQGYLFEVEPAQVDGLETISDRWPPQSPLGKNERRYWLFQADPTVWDLEKLFAEAKMGDTEQFTVSRYSADIQPGDGVVLWQSGPRAGAFALAEVSGPPFERRHADWQGEGPEMEWAVPIRYKRIFAAPVTSLAAQQNRVLARRQSRIAPQDTNYKLDRTEWFEIVRLADANREIVAVQPEVDIDAVTLASVCRDVADQMRTAGLQFGVRHDALVRTAITSLATKRFLILTGLSGSGKTRLAIAIGEWFGDERLQVIAVRPDWTGPDALLGYENGLTATGPDGRHAWSVPDSLAFTLTAARNPTLPYLLLLDEMNLAHVERYFADVLSGMESGKRIIPNLEFINGEWRSVGEALPFPKNLFIVGTVNVDETTYMFSPKVLDRANTLEFRVAGTDLQFDAKPIDVVQPGDAALVARFLHEATETTAGGNAYLTESLKDLHALLAEHDREFGHRVFYEALRFSWLWDRAGGVSGVEALDLQVLQKILPRFHGSIRQIARPLNDLGAWCFYGPKSARSPDFDPLETEGMPALPLSFDKIKRMVRRLRANHFVGFAE